MENIKESLSIWTNVQHNLLLCMLTIADPESPKNLCFPWMETYDAVCLLLESFRITSTPPLPAWPIKTLRLPKSRPTTDIIDEEVVQLCNSIYDSNWSVLAEQLCSSINIKLVSTFLVSKHTNSITKPSRK